MDALAAVILSTAIAAAGWFLRGFFTPVRRSERYDVATKMLDVRQKLATAGFDRREIDQFITILESDNTGERASSALRALGVHAAAEINRNGGAALETTAAMGARADARLKVLDAEIEQVLLDIEIMTSPLSKRLGGEVECYDADHARKMHRAWKVYRRRAAASAAQDYAGGSIVGVIWIVEEVRISERFLKDLRERLEELKHR